MEPILYDAVLVAHSLMHLLRPTDYRTPRVNPKVNYRPWLIIMCQYWLINCNRYTSLILDNTGGNCAGIYIHICLFFPLNISANLKLLFKNRSMKFLRYNRHLRSTPKLSDLGILTNYLHFIKFFCLFCSFLKRSIYF